MISSVDEIRSLYVYPAEEMPFCETRKYCLLILDYLIMQKKLVSFQCHQRKSLHSFGNASIFTFSYSKTSKDLLDIFKRND